MLAAMIVLARRGEAAAFRQMEGQKGATLGGLSALRRGWYYDQEPVAADAARAQEIHNAAVVFRAVVVFFVAAVVFVAAVEAARGERRLGLGSGVVVVITP